MVRVLKRNADSLYVCESCGFAYVDRSLARACEDYCRTHKSCSLEITKHAVPVED